VTMRRWSIATHRQHASTSNTPAAGYHANSATPIADAPATMANRKVQSPTKNWKVTVLGEVQEREEWQGWNKWRKDANESLWPATIIAGAIVLGIVIAWIQVHS